MAFFRKLRESMRKIDEGVDFIQNFDENKVESDDFFYSSDFLSKVYDVQKKELAKAGRILSASHDRMLRKNHRHDQFDYLYYDLFLDFVHEVSKIQKRYKRIGIAIPDLKLEELLDDEEEPAPEDCSKGEVAAKDSEKECLEKLPPKPLPALDSCSQDEAVVVRNKDTMQELKLAENDNQGASADLKDSTSPELKRPEVNLVCRYDSPTFLKILEMAEGRVSDEDDKPATVVQRPKLALSVEPDWPPSTTRPAVQHAVEKWASQIKTMAEQANVPHKGPSLRAIAKRLDFDTSSFSVEED